MKFIACALPSPHGGSALGILVILFCLVIVVTQGCKKHETIGGPPIDSGPTVPVINRILLVSRDQAWGKGAQICTVNADGSDFRRISYPTDSVNFVSAVWSPDLSQMAVVWNYFDQRRREFPMLSLADSTGKFLSLLDGACYGNALPVWSPDGKELAFAIPKGMTGVVPQAYTVNVASGAIKQLTFFGTSSAIDTSAMVFHWKQDGTFLAIVQFDSSSTRWGALCEVNVDGTLKRTFFNDGVRKPEWGDVLDSSLVCRYWRYGSITGLISVSESDTSIQLIREELYYQRTSEAYLGPLLSPNRRQVSFTVYRQVPTQGQIFVRDLASGDEQLIYSNSNCQVTDWR